MQITVQVNSNTNCHTNIHDSINEVHLPYHEIKQTNLQTIDYSVT